LLIAGTILQGTKLPMPVQRDALLAQGKQGLSNSSASQPAPRGGSAQADAARDRAQPPLQARRRRAAHRDRDACIAGERTGEGTERGRRGHTWIFRPAKIKHFMPASTSQPPSSAMAASGFAALPSSQVSSTSVCPVPIAPPHTPRFPLGERHARQYQEQSPGDALYGRRQTPAALTRRIRLALQPLQCPESHP
jgi:hypothetical protein